VASDEWYGYDDWTDSQQERWDTLNNSIDQNLQDDWVVQAMYDVAFNTPRGEIDGDLRWNSIEQLHEYLLDEYGYDFYADFDWAAWREEYSEG
jgi:hypothetical protein